MVQDELEGMAERCGWGQGNTWDDCMCCSTFDLEAFAKLVASAAIAKAFPDGVDAEWIARRTKYAVEQEREACAKVCAALMDSPELIGDCHICVEAIRARGEPTSRGEAA